METLFEKLKDYAGSEIYPCHMPGHKRQGAGALPQGLAELDITEIEGFDNLHQPEGVIRQLQQYAADAYGAEETYYPCGRKYLRDIERCQRRRSSKREVADRP